MSEATAVAILPTDNGSRDVIPNYEATQMAKVYREATESIARHMAEIAAETKRIEGAFALEAVGSYYRPFEIDFMFHSHRASADRCQEIFDQMKRTAWQILINKLGLRNIMSVKRRGEVDRQIEKGECPDINEETILDVLLGLADQARGFAAEAAKEVFEILRPHRSGYKTNNVFRIGRRVILAHRVDQQYDGKKFRPTHYREQELTAIDGIFHLLDGKGVMRENRGPLVNAILSSPDGKGETDYFRFKCFKNGNLHIEMKRLDLVMELNLQAVGERVLGNDA
jgi:hypothetical protein